MITASVCYRTGAEYIEWKSSVLKEYLFAYGVSDKFDQLKFQTLKVAPPEVKQSSID
jgi:hypothetical protein